MIEVHYPLVPTNFPTILLRDLLTQTSIYFWKLDGCEMVAYFAVQETSVINFGRLGMTRKMQQQVGGSARTLTLALFLRFDGNTRAMILDIDLPFLLPSSGRRRRDGPLVGSHDSLLRWILASRTFSRSPFGH